jgi:hypothetical protein
MDFFIIKIKKTEPILEEVIISNTFDTSHFFNEKITLKATFNHW